MDPNSAHQQWSEWVFRVVAPEHPPFALALDHLRRLTARVFGQHGRMKARQTRDFVEVVVQAETSQFSVLDPAWRAFIQRQLLEGVRPLWPRGFHVLWKEPKLLAGNPEDGRPPSQWIDIPTIATTLQVNGLAPAAQELGMPTIPSTARVWGS